MDFQPPQWGSARAHRAPRTAHRAHRRRAARSLKLDNLIPHCQFARLPLARTAPSTVAAQPSLPRKQKHSLYLPPLTLGVPPGAENQHLLPDYTFRTLTFRALSP